MAQTTFASLAYSVLKTFWRIIVITLNELEQTQRVAFHFHLWFLGYDQCLTETGQRLDLF